MNPLIRRLPTGGVPAQGYNLTVSHAPQVWDRILEVGRGDLTLSGHVHSMQFKVRVGRWRWSPAAWLYDRWSGRYDEAGRVLYITDGIGCALLPMRVGTRPEITVLELKTETMKVIAFGGCLAGRLHGRLYAPTAGALVCGGPGRRCYALRAACDRDTGRRPRPCAATIRR